jgi:hypothetical protein
MQRVRGVGGVFLKPSSERQALLVWYREHLGIEVDETWGGTVFPKSPFGLTWSIFALDNEYGKLCWAYDPAGHRIELWQCPDDPTP